MSDKTNKSNFIWPTIVDLPSAIAATNQGSGAAVFVAVLTALLVTYSLLVTENFSVYAWSYIDAALFSLIAWKIKRYSRIFAVFGLCLFVLEISIQFSQGKLYSIALLIAFALLMSFINGVRGTFAIHRFSRNESGRMTVQQESPI